MTDPQWQTLLSVIAGDHVAPPPVGLIVDSPWLPGWAGVSTLDYLYDEPTWLAVNRKAVERFPQVMLLPGFWSEYGMCTEPSAFGGKCIFYEESFPGVGRVLFDYGDVAHLGKPDCRTDGLLPMVLKRLVRCRGAIEGMGHRIRFAVARGPLNIASYLLGHTEFLIGVKTNPDEIHQLLRVVTDFLVDWIALQADKIDSIDGIFLLDDLVGFLREDDFRQFALPYLKQVYDSRNVSVKFLHNDAAGLVTARHLAEMGVNLFNFSFNHSLAQIRSLAGEGVALLGNVPPRDVLAQGNAEAVGRAVDGMFAGLPDRRRVVVSAGGGASPGTPAENIDAMLAACQQLR